MKKSDYKYKKQVRIGDKRIWLYGNSEASIKRQKEKLKAEYLAKKESADTFLTCANRWMEIHTVQNASSTRSMNELCVKHCESIHDKKVSEITYSDCQKVINEYMDRPDMAKRIAQVMHQVFAQLVRDGMLQRNPAEGLTLPKKVKKPKRALTEAEKDAVRTLLSEDDTRLTNQEKMFLAMLYYFGLRPEEARALTVWDFDLEAETVTISKALAFAGSQGELKNTKTNNVRDLPIPRAVMPLIRSYVEPADKLYLFTNAWNNVHSKTSYRHMWENHILKAIQDEAGFSSGLTPYCFRRNYATNLYYSGISLKKAAYLMGHASTKMILEVYAQIDDERENLDSIRNFE